MDQSDVWCSLIIKGFIYKKDDLKFYSEFNKEPIKGRQNRRNLISLIFVKTLNCVMWAYRNKLTSFSAWPLDRMCLFSAVFYRWGLGGETLWNFSVTWHVLMKNKANLMPSRSGDRLSGFFFIDSGPKITSVLTKFERRKFSVIQILISPGHNIICKFSAFMN